MAAASEGDAGVAVLFRRRLDSRWNFLGGAPRSSESEDYLFRQVSGSADDRGTDD